MRARIRRGPDPREMKSARQKRIRSSAPSNSFSVASQVHTLGRIRNMLPYSLLSMLGTSASSSSNATDL